MSEQAHPHTHHAATKGRARKVTIGCLAIAGGLLLLTWSFVLPILGIIHIVQMLS